MYFCEELAVLHGAFCHADEVLSNGLCGYEPAQDSNCLEIICQAENEVLQGLRTNRTEDEKSKWAENVVVQLLLLSAASHGPFLVEELESSDELAACISGMPPINSKLMVDVVQQCHLVDEFLQIVHGLDKVVARKLLYDVLQHISESVPEKYTELLESITQYISLAGNIVLNDSKPEERDLSKDDGENGASTEVKNALNTYLLLPFERGYTDTAGKVAVVQELLECWKMTELTSYNIGVVMSLLNLIVKSSEIKSALSLTDISRTSRKRVMERRETFINSCQNRDDNSLTKLAVNFQNRQQNDSLNEPERLVFPIILVNQLVEVTNNVLQDSSDIFRQLKRNSRSLKSSDIVTMVTPSEIDSVLSSSIQALHLKQQSLQSNLMSASALESLIHTLIGLQEEYKTWIDACSNLSAEEQLTLNMYLVEEGLNGQEEWNWIVESAPQMDRRWLDFLNKHHKCVTAANLQHLLAVLQNENFIRLQGPLNANVLQQIIIKSFHNLSLKDKNEILRHVDMKYRANPFLFEEDINKKLTVVFNRITNQKQSKDEAVIAEVALLALQESGSVVEKVVQTAISNGGQAEALCQLLLDLPFLHQVTSQEKSASLLCVNIDSHFHCKLSKKEQENGLKFMQLLFKENVLSPSETVQLIVLPHVFQTSSDEENAIPVLLTLEVLHLALECSKTCDWLVTIKVPPIIYCLCDLIDCSRRKWAEQQNDNEAEQIAVVEKAVRTLHLLVEKVSEHMDCMPVAGIKWLYQKMAEHPWHLSLHLINLYEMCSLPVIPLVLPKNCSDLLELGDRKIQPCKMEDFILICLHMAKASDHSLQLLLLSLKPEISVFKDLSFEKIVSVVTHFLQQSTVAEGLRIAELLNYVVSSEDPQNVPWPEVEKDQIISDDSRQILWLMKVLHYCVLITAKKKCESFSHLAHMARIYVAVMEKYCINDDKVKSLQVASAVNVFSQGFAHCSLQVAALPEICEDQLLVVALHLLSALSKQISSCGQEEQVVWLQQKESMNRCLQLWSEEKQSLFMKKMPA